MTELLKDKKGIFFDVGWTLDAPASGDWMLTNRFLDAAGRERIDSIPLSVRRAAFDEAFHELNQNHRLDTVDEEIEQFTRFYKTFARLCGIPLCGGDALEISRDRALNMNNYIFFDDAAPTLAQLYKTHKLGVISDTWPSIHAQLDSGSVKGYFSCFTFSFELGVYKPHPDIYRDALSKMGLAPEDTVFIDDCVENLRGAASFGITPILIAVRPDAPRPAEYPAITGLIELLG